MPKAADTNAQKSDWFEDYADEEEEFQIDEYDLTATPNDFNVLTINNFIESGAVKIPGFQRNYKTAIGFLEVVPNKLREHSLTNDGATQTEAVGDGTRLT